MIGNKKSPMGMDAPSTDAVNRIVEGTVFEGNIRSASNMRVTALSKETLSQRAVWSLDPRGRSKAT